MCVKEMEKEMEISAQNCQTVLLSDAILIEYFVAGYWVLIINKDHSGQCHLGGFRTIFVENGSHYRPESVQTDAAMID